MGVHEGGAFRTGPSPLGLASISTVLSIAQQWGLLYAEIRVIEGAQIPSVSGFDDRIIHWILTKMQPLVLHGWRRLRWLGQKPPNSMLNILWFAVVSIQAIDKQPMVIEL